MGVTHCENVIRVIQDSLRILDSKPRIPDSTTGLRILFQLNFGFRIPIVKWILDVPY